MAELSAGDTVSFRLFPFLVLPIVWTTILKPFFSLIHNKRSGKSCAAQVRLIKKNEAAEETAKVAEKVKFSVTLLW